MRMWPGSPYPPGATWDRRGVNVALFSAHATNGELCLVETVDAQSAVGRMALPEQTDQAWHGYRPAVLPGQLSGYRVHGPDAPPQGHRFTPHNGLLDPYATSIGRDGRWADELLGYRRGDPDADRSFDERDSAADAPLAVVIDPAFPWGDDRPPRTPWHKTLIYELHVQGCTQLHPAVPERRGGTSLGQTQQGKHNTSCQDHERTWLNWPLTDAQRAWGNFVRAALQVRRTQPVFRRRKFFYDRAIHGEGIQDISWFDASGQDMTEKDWQHGYVCGLGVRLAGDLIGGTDERSEPVVGDTVLLLMNAHDAAIPLMLPRLTAGQRWERVLDTAPEPLPFAGEPPYALQGRPMAVLHTTRQHTQAWQAFGTAAVVER